ncbi:unnamed protein product [Malus baccata var. baccata]
MEPENIDWSSIESVFVEDETYENFDTPKWVDLSSPDELMDDDQDWFCTPDCKHSKAAEDFVKPARNLKVKLMRSLTSSEILPFRERNRRDMKAKGTNLPNMKNENLNSFSNVHEESENKNPNIPASIPRCKTKSKKAVVNPSSEKKKQVDESSFQDSSKNGRKPQLKTTFSASNLLGGREILNQITEFCTELKKLARRGSRKGGREGEKRCRRWPRLSKPGLLDGRNGVFDVCGEQNSYKISFRNRISTVDLRRGQSMLTVIANLLKLIRNYSLFIVSWIQKVLEGQKYGDIAEESSKIMLSIQKWKCPGSQIATVTSVVALVSIVLVSIVHLFWFPLVPSFAYFSQAQNSCVPINGSADSITDHVKGNLRSPMDLDRQFPSDLHKAVVFHGAPWKAEIGRWLAGCHSISNEVDIVEVVVGAKMTAAVKASVTTNWENVGAFMDTVVTDLDNVFTTNSSKPGWCNVDPAEAYALKVKFKEECDCKYDGFGGRFCEVPTVCTCINQCSGRGHCRGGFCECNNGWYGIDCSIPSVASSVREWPQWLRPAQVDVPDSSHLPGKVDNLNAVVKKKRPLIYVYDLPPDFNSLLLEGRHFRLECVNRIYDDRNSTLWTDQLYGAQMALYESILASPYRTLNGEEADFFFVPVLDSCIITRADDAPHLSMQEHKGLRSSLTLEYYRKAYDHIVEQYPFWNRSSGRDHIWFFSWDEGACYAPKEIWSSMMLVHWGNTNSKHKNSTTAYWADNWNDISSDKRGNHPCFDPDKDLVLPAWKSPDVNSLSSKLWSRSRENRKTLFYFNGNLGPAYPNGRPEASYSMGIRQKLAEEFGSSPNKEGKLGKQHAEDVIVTPLRSENYHLDIASSIFCGVFPGDGWSGRMEDCVLQGCIPVVIQDGIFLPYENVLNYESFAVRIREDEIPNLINILRAFNETEIKFRLANVQKIWQRFLYRDSIMLEAERQKTVFGRMREWAAQFSQLIEDDVFATLIQVLHYKLHNDPWRQHVHVKREFGLPQECLFKSN